MISPCINVCKMNPTNSVCEGCKRTLEEISNWVYFTEEQRIKIMLELKTR